MSVVALPPLVSPSPSPTAPERQDRRQESDSTDDEGNGAASRATPRRGPRSSGPGLRPHGKPATTTGMVSPPPPLSAMGMTPNAIKRIEGAGSPSSRSPSRGAFPSALTTDIKRRATSRGRELNTGLSSPDERRAGWQRPPRGHERGTLAHRKSDRAGTNGATGDRDPRDKDPIEEENLHAAEADPGQGGPSSPTPAGIRPRVPAELHNAFSIGSMLGSGAFGTVWIAQSRATSERVAIKIVERQRQLHEDFSLEPAEAEILKTVDHPSIVKLMDYVSSELCVYLIMELVLGGQLQGRLRQQGAYDEHEAKLMLRQVFGAVHHLHDRNIIHRDIKPENILFVEEDDHITVKLSDFGLSTQKEGRLTTRCGTPSYCAPELLSGAGYGKSVDVWSLGVLTYVVLCGVLPFVGSDRADLFRKIQKGCFRFDSAAAETPEGRDQVRSPSDLARDFVARLLKLVPMERYSTREALQHPWLDPDGVSEGSDAAPVKSLNTVHEMMRRFNAERRLKRVAYVVIACGRFVRAAQGWPRLSDGIDESYRPGSPVSGWASEEDPSGSHLVPGPSHVSEGSVASSVVGSGTGSKDSSVVSRDRSTECRRPGGVGITDDRRHDRRHDREA